MLSDGPPSLTCCPDGPLTFEPAASLFLAIPFPCRDIHWEATGVRAGFNIALATIFVNENLLGESVISTAEKQFLGSLASDSVEHI